MSQPDEHHDYWDARAAEYDALILALEVERLRPITRPPARTVSRRELQLLIEETARTIDKRPTSGER